MMQKFISCSRRPAKRPHSCKEAPEEPEFAISLDYKQITPLESGGRLLIALEELPVLYRYIAHFFGSRGAPLFLSDFPVNSEIEIPNSEINPELCAFKK